MPRKRAVRRTRKPGKKPPVRRTAGATDANKAPAPRAVARPERAASDMIEIPDELPLLALRNTVVFPGAIIPLTVGRDKSLGSLSVVLENDGVIGVVSQKAPETDDPTLDDLYRVGTICQILKALAMPDGTQNVIAQGIARFHIDEIVRTEPHLVGRTSLLAEEENASKELEALALNIRELGRRSIELSEGIPDEVVVILQNIERPGQLADYLAAHLSLSVIEKQDVLEETNIRNRLQKLSVTLVKTLEVLELSHRIQSEVRGQIDKSQREYFLREQLKAIQRELGVDEGGAAEINELREKVAEAKMPENVQKEALRELERLARVPTASPEHPVIRNYVEWLVELPWSTSTPDRIDIDEAEKILNEDHHDLEKVKRRILEFLAVRKLKDDTKGPILFFCGPPGVGKTSLGRSIARAMGRRFIRISLGGMRDEAEIRGHRRTYVGALPGRVIQEMRKAGANNPVFMLDEIDKIGADFRGDPASALLEVLDPEQNFSFTDHYLDLPFDLSKVMFIATGNVLDTVPAALHDRMEVLEIPGYTEEDKLVIAEKYIVPKQTDQNGLTRRDIHWNRKALTAVIRRYTREAGLRNLEREVASVSRGVAREVAAGKTAGKVVVTPERVRAILGPEKFEHETAHRLVAAGIAIGLAWTPVGGDILFIEATKMPGKGKLLLTGQIGDVMKESAQAALSYVRSRAGDLAIDDAQFDKIDLHVHIPAGAVPKDGPSAGVTVLAALVSLLTGRLLRNDLAMTGEISLRGKVLPVGGIKEKLLAALRAGIREVILPERNRADLEDVPTEARNKLKLTFVSTLDDVLENALASQRSSSARRRRA